MWTLYEKCRSYARPERGHGLAFESEELCNQHNFAKEQDIVSQNVKYKAASASVLWNNGEHSWSPRGNDLG